MFTNNAMPNRCFAMPKHGIQKCFLAHKDIKSTVPTPWKQSVEFEEKWMSRPKESLVVQ